MQCYLYESTSSRNYITGKYVGSTTVPTYYGRVGTLGDVVQPPR